MIESGCFKDINECENRKAEKSNQESNTCEPVPKPKRKRNFFHNFFRRWEDGGCKEDEKLTEAPQRQVPTGYEKWNVHAGVPADSEDKQTSKGKLVISPAPVQPRETGTEYYAMLARLASITAVAAIPN
uniref:G protein-coupled receptor kinase 4 n=1 Tax=Molossus molossus TaxID=27622 RepID=A0A7J8JTU0_MOLMO|nr:G protein-coupled receptor kinase 4 [Molossus molossus]